MSPKREGEIVPIPSLSAAFHTAVEGNAISTTRQRCVVASCLSVRARAIVALIIVIITAFITAKMYHFIQRLGGKFATFDGLNVGIFFISQTYQ